MIKDLLNKLVSKQNLTEEEASAVMNEIMSGTATPSQISAFLTALHMKGETVDEVVGCVRVMREKALKIEKPISLKEQPMVDTCGTGGTGVDTFNISTAVAILTAACGVRVAKHGNRAASSKCGSADVLESLGVKIDLGPEKAMDCLINVGMCFLFAPIYHVAMRHVMPTRREIGFKTIFNILGPLSNPFFPTGQLLGVFSEDLSDLMANVLLRLGIKKAYVVYGYDRTDEISITTITKVVEVSNGRISTYYIKPEDFGFKRATLEELKGGTKKENAEIILSIFKGEKSARRDIVVLNTAFGILASELISNVYEAIKIAEESINKGKPLDLLNRLIEFTNKC